MCAVDLVKSDSGMEKPGSRLLEAQERCICGCRCAVVFRYVINYTNPLCWMQPHPHVEHRVWLMSCFCGVSFGLCDCVCGCVCVGGWVCVWVGVCAVTKV